MDKRTVTKNNIINICGGKSLIIIDFMLAFFVIMIIGVSFIIIHEFDSIMELEEKSGLRIILLNYLYSLIY